MLPGLLEFGEVAAAPGSAQEQMLPRSSRLLPPGAGKVCTADGSWDLMGFEDLKCRFPLTRLLFIKKRPSSLKNRKIADPKLNPKLNF